MSLAAWSGTVARMRVNGAIITLCDRAIPPTVIGVKRFISLMPPLPRAIEPHHA